MRISDWSSDVCSSDLSQNRFIQLSATIALRHQERYDCRGYPDGLAVDEIPIEARIVAVADVFDALISVRPYKLAWSFDEALAFISAHICKLFAPMCVHALLPCPAHLLALSSPSVSVLTPSA